MDNIVPKYYKEYGEYVNSGRAFPYILDGCKPVERRILYASYLIARSKTVKCAKINGQVIGNYHPHGDCYVTICSMVYQGFLIGQGNFGTKSGIQAIGPAASRYTEAKLSPHINELAFKYLEGVDWFINDLSENEPTHLPTMFPLCLCGNEYNTGIGFAFRTTIPNYELSDLYKRLFWLINKRENPSYDGSEPIIRPRSDCSITADDNTLKQLLTKGKASISVCGVFEEDAKNHKVYLYSWPYGKTFPSLLNKFSDELGRNDIGFADLTANDETKIEFEVLKQRNKDIIYASFVEKLKEVLVGNISFDIITVDENKQTCPTSVDTFLLKAYDSFLDANINVLNQQTEKIGKDIDELHILAKIKPSLSSTLRNGLNYENSIDYIHDKSKVDKKTIRGMLSKHRISKLLNLDTDTSGLENEKEEIENNINDINNFVFTQYQQLF